jgi:predicted phosphodiesterase
MLGEKIRIAIITDVHGNLPALKAVINEIKKLSCEHIFHLGDSIGIGPFPKERLELMLQDDKINMIMGNHETYFAFGIPSYVTGGEVEHQKWVHTSLNETLRLSVSKFPYVVSKQYFNIIVTFLHYPLRDDSGKFKAILKNPTPSDLDELFKDIKSDIIFYGHHHPFTDVEGRARYINPGSLGCSQDSMARFTILEITKEEYSIEHKAVPYSKEQIFYGLENREVPEREFISKIFFGKL